MAQIINRRLTRNSAEKKCVTKESIQKVEFIPNLLCLCLNTSGMAPTINCLENPLEKRHLQSHSKMQVVVEGLPCSPRKPTLVKHASNASMASRQTPRRRRSSASQNNSRMKRFIVAGQDFVLPQRYSPVKLIGSGTFGSVCSAMDSTLQSKVAIKKINDVSSDPLEGKRVIREIKLLSHFDHPNIVKLIDVVDCSPKTTVQDICLVMEYVPSDLRRVIRSSTQLSPSHIAFISYQVLCGILALHSANVVHRDLKPSNILINASCRAKICDFGLARGILQEDELLTEYVVTRWYRAPELIVKRDYDASIDMWSLGCVIAEMFTGKALFRGDNYVDQLDAIMELLGSPTVTDLKHVKNAEILEFIKDSGHEGKPWSQILPGVPQDAVDLISNLVVFNPKKRLSAKEALRHPFFSDYFDEVLMKDTIGRVKVFDFSFEKMIRFKEDVQHLLVHEMASFYPDQFHHKIRKERHKKVMTRNTIYFTGRRRTVF